MTGRVMWYFIAGLPVLLFGTWAGSFLYGRIKEETYRNILLTVMGLLGLLMLMK